MSKVSEATFFVFGLVGPKARPYRRSLMEEQFIFCYRDYLIKTQREYKGGISGRTMVRLSSEQV